MNKIMLSAAMAAVLATTGCISVNKNDGGNALKNPAALTEGYKQTFKVADEQVEAKDHINVLFGFIAWGSSATHVADNFGGEGFGFIVPADCKAKNGAFANACDAAKADTILGARYNVTTKDYFVFKQIDATIKGY